MVPPELLYLDDAFSGRGLCYNGVAFRDAWDAVGNFAKILTRPPLPPRGVVGTELARSLLFFSFFSIGAPQLCTAVRGRLGLSKQNVFEDFVN